MPAARLWEPSSPLREGPGSLSLHEACAACEQSWRPWSRLLSPQVPEGLGLCGFHLHFPVLVVISPGLSQELHPGHPFEAPSSAGVLMPSKPGPYPADQAGCRCLPTETSVGEGAPLGGIAARTEPMGPLPHCQASGLQCWGRSVSEWKSQESDFL